MSDKCYSTFVADHIYYDFIALLNSWRYYEHKYPLKVYAGGALSQDKIRAIEKHCEVIVDDYGTKQEYKTRFMFKYMVLSKHMAEHELCIDADTLFLSNLDHLFDHIEQGKLVVAKENFGDLVHSIYNSTEDIESIAQALVPYIGFDTAKNFNSSTTSKGYNGGFLGLNRSKHQALLDKVVELLRSDLDFKNDPVINNEQYTMCFLVNLMNIDRVELSQTQWMNTWSLHKHPKKILQLENGKFSLYNLKDNQIDEKVNFYHFTGGLTFKDDRGNLSSAKPYMLKDPAKTDIVEHIFYENFENPALLLYEHFLNKGI